MRRAIFLATVLAAGCGSASPTGTPETKPQVPPPVPGQTPPPAGKAKME